MAAKKQTPEQDTKDKMTAIRLESAQHERLVEIGKEIDRPVSWIIRKAVDEYLERYKSPK